MRKETASDIHLDPPAPSLFPTGRGPNDRRLGDRVTRGPDGLDRAGIVLLGSPQDHGVRRVGGRPGAAAGPYAIRRQLYALPAPPTLPEGWLYDAGDLRIPDGLEAAHARQESLASRFLGRGKTVIVLGGGNDISYPDVSALAGRSRSLLAFNIDGHFDVRDAPLPNSGTPYRQLLEEGRLLPERFYEMGHKPDVNNAADRRYLADRGVPVLSLDRIRRSGVTRTFSTILRRHRTEEAVFWGFDMDAVQSSDAPGVSAPCPIGFTAAEICTVAALAGREPRTRLIEISECNPLHDLDDRTSRLAAMIIHSFLSSREGRCGRDPAAENDRARIPGMPERRLETSPIRSSRRRD